MKHVPRKKCPPHRRYTLELVLDGNLAELARLTAETARFCRQYALGDDLEFDLNLVLEELFVNSVRHGGCKAVEFEVAMTPDGVTLEYADRGPAFDPTQAAVPDVTAPLEDRPVGGLGIHLARQVMRDIEYHRVDGWNRIRMRRPIASEGT